MAGAIIEISYFNTFILKRNKSIASSSDVPEFNSTIPGGFYLATNLPSDYTVCPGGTNCTIYFPTLDNSVDWFIEESRIRGGYNNTSVDYGVKAYLTEEFPIAQHRFNSLIYSGIYNSRTGVNESNQFPVGQEITRSLDPAYVSIQKLYAENTNLTIFQEEKVSKALIDKDAIYSAEGQGITTAGAQVIGQTVPYAGEYGISTDPQSFAQYGYRIYFSDRRRNCICRLSANGIEEISSFGMHDYFRDELSALEVSNVVGGFDEHTKNYVVSIQDPKIVTGISYSDTPYATSSFDESVKGWPSFYNFKPELMASLGPNFYSFYRGKIWQHYTDQEGTNNDYAKFYNTVYNSSVTVILNSQPSVVKNFKTLNYEGAVGWEMSSLVASSGDITFPITKYVAQTTLSGLETSIFTNSFKKKESKFFANLMNNSPATPGEILFGQESTGVKGFFSTVVMTLNNTLYPTTKSELFAVSTDYVESSY
tara:strand:- start:6196 stop:7635 length:1440 start_codon:yes stop_codon:yes gene_type:complete